MTGALAVASKYNLEPLKKVEGWGSLVRGHSASQIFSNIIPGKYLEVFDKKFNGESLIIFRRSDFDNLNMLSSMASKVSRYLMQIDRITTTYRDGDDPKKFIELIHEEARMGIEFTIVRSTSTSSDYFQSAVSSSDWDDVVLPKMKKKK
jgi:hypothetical protein